MLIFYDFIKPVTFYMQKIFADYVQLPATNVLKSVICSKTTTAKNVQMYAATVPMSVNKWLEFKSQIK